MSDILVQIRNVSKIFEKGLSPALQNINAEVPKGQIVGMAGPDGAGKTTLIRLIAGLLKPSSGSISVAGFDTMKDPENIHRIIGYMPQKFGLYEDLTVLQNLNLYADLKGVAEVEREDEFKKIFSFTGLFPFQNRLAGALSGGMKQKLGLGCALLKKPAFLLLDEPSVGVDPVSRRELWHMVFALVQEGISVIWSTAYLDEMEKCDSVLLLSEGKLIYQGSQKALIEKMEGRTMKEGATPPSQAVPVPPRFEDAFIDILGGGPGGGSVLTQIMPDIKMQTDHIIEAKGLTKKFGSFTAASDITFTVRSGEIFGLLGPNGAGKSTTFKMLCGLLTPTSGKASVMGLDLQEAPSEARQKIGYMAQKFSLYGDLSAQQNLEFFSGIYNLRGKEQSLMIQKMIEIFALQPYLETTSNALPLGFKQRLALSCAIMHHPAILFLDEPTSGVDPITRREFWNHINGLVEKGVTVMVTTHFVDEAEYCDRIALIYQSKIIHMGTPDDLKELARSKEHPSPTLEDAFIKLIEHYDQS